MDTGSEETKHLFITGDIGEEGESEVTLNPGESKKFNTKLPPGFLTRRHIARLPDELPFSKDRPVLDVIRNNFGFSLKSRLERSGLNVNRVAVRPMKDGSVQIKGELGNNGTATVKYDPSEMYRLYSLTDSPLEALARTLPTIFDPSRSTPKWAEEFVELNKHLINDLYGYSKRDGKLPLMYQLESSLRGALVFILPLEKHYVMNPGSIIDHSATRNLTAREAISPFEYPITNSSQLGGLPKNSSGVVQVMSDTPFVSFPENMGGVITTIIQGDNPYRTGFNVAGWTVPFDTARLHVGGRYAPPHGGSNLLDPLFKGEIATEVITTPQLGLPQHAAVFVMQA